MAVIHYLNVKQGDCSIIQHNTGHVSVIDVCNASADTPEARLREQMEQAARLRPSGTYQQKHHPVNPILYLKEHGVSSVFRFVLTHPDMDHMDGIEAFFREFEPTNFWDTDNTCEKDFEEGSPYNSPAPRFPWTLICDKECQDVRHETSGFRARARSPEGD